MADCGSFCFGKIPATRASVEQQLGDYFGACMNEPAIDSAGMTPLSALLADIGSIQDPAGIQRMIRRLHEIALSDLHGEFATVVDTRTVIDALQSPGSARRAS